MVASSKPIDTDVQSSFVTMLPDITGRLGSYFRGSSPEQREERTAEAVAMAWQLYSSARNAGRNPGAATLAWYCSRLVRSGRRLSGSTSLDAMSPGRGHAFIDDTPRDPKHFTMVFADRRGRWSVPDAVSFMLDWREYLSRCRNRDRRIVNLRLRGESQKDIARLLKITPPAVNQRLSALQRGWRVFQEPATAAGREECCYG